MADNQDFMSNWTVSDFKTRIAHLESCLIKLKSEHKTVIDGERIMSNWRITDFEEKIAHLESCQLKLITENKELKEKISELEKKLSSALIYI